MMRRLRRGGFAFDIVGHRKKWYVISAIVLLVSAGSLAIRQLNLGLEFRGGASFEVQAESDASIADMRNALEDLDVEPVVQGVRSQSGENGFLIQTRAVSEQLQLEVTRLVAQVAGVDSNDVNVTAVGPKWGAQITEKAVRALIIFLLVAALYISLRFEPKMAAGAMIALFHDLTVTAGIYSLTGFVVTPATVIALLTILGYSLYDTCVIFDRIKDDSSRLSASGRLTYSQMANESLNKVLVRSLNTSVTSLIPTGSLLFVGSFLLGAETLRELALALFIGMAAGTYSSVFVAAPILAAWKEREARWATLRARIAARSGETTAPRAVRSGAEEADDDEETEEVTAGSAGSNRPMGRPPKPPKNKRRKRRR